MRIILAAGLAALFAISINRAAVRGWGRPAIVLMVPLIEEGLKTGLGLAAGASLLGAHLLFGVFEAIYDGAIDPRRQVSLALSSILGHLLFGGITVLSLWLSGSPYLSIGAAVLAHCGWNALFTAPLGSKAKGEA